MATRIVAQAVQRASRPAFRLLPLQQQQQQQQHSIPTLELGFPHQTDAGASHGSMLFNKMPSPQFAVSPLLEEEQQLHRILKLGLGFPPQIDAGASRGSIFLFNMPSPQSALSPHLEEQLQNGIPKVGSEFPLLSAQNKLSTFAPETLWKFTNSNYFPPSSEMDEVILPGQHEDTSSPMLMNTKRTFQPSTIVRKRRHGFLARLADSRLGPRLYYMVGRIGQTLRHSSAIEDDCSFSRRGKATVGGRRILLRRFAKGRRKLSA